MLSLPRTGVGACVDATARPQQPDRSGLPARVANAGTVVLLHTPATPGVSIHVHVALEGVSALKQYHVPDVLPRLESEPRLLPDAEPPVPAASSAGPWEGGSIPRRTEAAYWWDRRGIRRCTSVLLVWALDGVAAGDPRGYSMIPGSHTVHRANTTAAPTTCHHFLTLLVMLHSAHPGGPAPPPPPILTGIPIGECSTSSD